MPGINYININGPILSNDPNIGIISSVPTKRRKLNNKILIKVTHLEDEATNEYVRTEVEYHLPKRPKPLKDYTNIYTDQEYSWLVKSYENRAAVTKGVNVYYDIACYKTPNKIIHRRPKEKYNPITIADDIVIKLPEAHYIIDDSDQVRFRLSELERYSVYEFPTPNVHWVQKQHRPAYYSKSLDSSHRFDSNSIYVYLNKKLMYTLLSKPLFAYQKGEARDMKQKRVRDFVQTLFEYTMLLWYINTSWGWKYEDITYDRAWNLALYILWNVKPFTPHSDYDWLPDKASHVRYLFNKYLENFLSAGIKHSYYKLATRRSLFTKVSRHCYPEGMSRLEKEMFKEFVVKSDSKVERLERNERIKELYKELKSIRKVALKVGCSLGTVQSVLKNSSLLKIKA